MVHPSPDLRAALRASLAAEADGSLLAWLEQRRAATPGQVESIEDRQLRGWSLTDDRMAIVHQSGGFFSIVGVEVELERGRGREQLASPLIAQSERGLLGLLLRVIEDRAEVLVQAKREPGDPRGAQLAPTVQATKSNYTRVHGGRRTLGLERFVQAPARARVFDADLPEQADLFLAKFNRNTVVLVEDAPELAAEPDFRWASLAELGQALREDEAVNMSLRSVLSGLAAACIEPSPTISTGEGASARWLAERRASGSRRAIRRRLDRLPGWRLHPGGLEPEDPGGLSVVYVDVHFPRREVPRWTQPMLARAELGRVELHVCREPGGAPCVLLRPTLGPGQEGGVRFGPSLHHTRADGGGEARGFQTAARTLFDAQLSEDGGRLLAIRHRYRVLEHRRRFDPGPQGRWVALAELPELLARGCLDVEARTCLSALVLSGG
jgi:oxidase EvaA